MKQIQKIEQMMSKHPLTVGYEDSIQKASELMIENRFRHLPVTDHIGEVVGILSDRDVQRAMEARRHGVEMEMVIAPHRKVKDFMSWPPHSVTDSAKLYDVVKLMINEKISALLINSELTGKVRGIITSEDMLKEFCKMLEDKPVQPLLDHQ